jgi:hypothetical protein
LILYLDTSVLVSAHTKEVRTKDVLAWLAKKAGSGLATSDWVVAEFSAALSKKQRVGEIDGPFRAYALAEFHRAMLPGLTSLTIRSSDFSAAARFADQYALGLRAADALHLAIATGNGATLHTLDDRLAKAGVTLGVHTVLV